MLLIVWAKSVPVWQLNVVDLSHSAAGDKVIGQYLFKLLRGMALVACIPASCSKTTARLGIDRRDDFALQNDAFLPVVNIRGGDCGDQRPGIRMQGFLEQLPGGACLNQLAQVHHTNII